jgi:hypothetical protein
MMEEVWKEYRKKYGEGQYQRTYKRINIFYDYLLLKNVLKKAEDYETIINDDVDYWISIYSEKLIYEKTSSYSTINERMLIKQIEIVSKIYNDQTRWYKYAPIITSHSILIRIRTYTMIYMTLENLINKKLGQDILRIINNYLGTRNIKELVINTVVVQI